MNFNKRQFVSRINSYGSSGIAGLLLAMAVAAACPKTYGIAPDKRHDAFARLDPITVYRHWAPERIPPIEANHTKYDNARVRIIGHVMQIDGLAHGAESGDPTTSDVYILRDYARGYIHVRTQKSLPMPGDDILVLGVVRTDPFSGTVLIDESWRFLLDRESVREWADFDPFFAMENAFRTILCVNSAGISLPPFTRGQWDDGTVRTSVDEIEKHMAQD